MKKYFLIFLTFLFLQSCMVSRKADFPFFSIFNGQENLQFASIDVPMWMAKPYIKNTLRNEGESEELIRLIKKVKDIKVLTILGLDTNIMSGFQDYLQKNQYNEWMTVKKSNEQIRFQAQEINGEIQKIMITIQNNEECVLVNIEGKFSPEDISNLINYSEGNNKLRKMLTQK